MQGISVDKYQEIQQERDDKKKKRQARKNMVKHPVAHPKKVLFKKD